MFHRNTVLLLMSMFVATSTVRAEVIQFIDFETDGSGNPSMFTTGFLPANEYVSLGVTISVDGLGSAQTRLALVGSFDNIGTSPINGYRIASGAVAGVETYIELAFAPKITSISFDWYSSTAATSVLVSLFGDGDTPLGTFSPPADSTVIVPGSAFVFQAGSFSADLGGTEIHRVLVEDQQSGTHGIGLDNLTFTQVPEPTSALFLGCSGALACLRRRRR